MHTYRAFGLTIDSELDFPELSRGEGTPDLVIRFGNVPESIANPTVTGGRFQATASQFVLRVDGHARYFAANGSEIVVARERHATAEAVRLFLLGSVMGAILHQRGLLVLHASAVDVRGGAAIFMGPSGAGKSTLAAALASRGHRPLSDEITAITLRNGQPYVLPGFPQLNIWADAAQKLGQDLGALRRVRPELEKYAARFEDGYGDSPLRISDAYLLSTDNTNELKMERLKGVEKLTAVVAQTYRPRFLGDGDWKARHFQQCAAVADHARVHKLVRLVLSFALAETVDAVERACSS